MVLLLSAFASASTLTVGSSGYGSVQAAIDAAGAGDEIVVDPGTWTGTVDFRGKAVTVRSRDGAGATVLDGGIGFWAVVFQSGEGAGSVLEGFTVTNAGGAGVYVLGSGPVLRDLVLTGIGVYGSGTPGLYSVGGAATVDACAFTGIAGQYGGAVYVEGGTLGVTGSTFSGNTAYYGGALFLTGGATVTMAGSSVTDNVAGQAAVYLASGATFRASDSAFDRNAAVWSGAGAFGVEGGATLELTGGSLSENYADDYEATQGYGGAIYSGGAVRIAGTRVEGNQAYMGGAFAQVGGTLDLVGAAIVDNYAYQGGGLYLWGGGALTDVGSTWDSNTSYSSAGAILAYNSFSASLTDVVATENLATYGYAGFFYGYNGTLSVSGGTFRENVGYYGGGVFLFSELYSTATLADATFAYNDGTYGSGGVAYHQYYSSIDAQRCTFEGNTAYRGGAFYSYYANDLVIADSTFAGNLATYYDGGAIVHDYQANGYGALTVTGSTFEENAAANEGGAISTWGASVVTLTDSRFEQNEAGTGSFGGALYAGGMENLVVRRSLLSGNVARYGGAAYVEAPTRAAVFTNDVVQENVAADGGAFCAVRGGNHTWTNNALVGNAATEDGGAACLDGVTLRFTNNVVAWTGDGAAVHDYATEGPATLEVGYNAFYANVEGDQGGAAPVMVDQAGSLAVDPAFLAWTRNGDPTDDNLHLRRDSALLDAGDPELLDPDGSRSDIGAYGGPDAPAGDADGDGWDASADCDDGDASVHPGATDAPYDGVNADCSGASDYDADGDGVDAASFGGDDCDDTDPTVQLGCADGLDDTGGGGGGDGGGGSEGCGCASPGGSGGGAALGLALAALGVARRRR